MRQHRSDDVCASKRQHDYLDGMPGETNSADNETLERLVVLIRQAMIDRGYVAADGATPSPARLREAMAAATPPRRVDAGALGYLIKGVRERWGKGALAKVVDFLELAGVTEEEIGAAARANTTAPKVARLAANDAYARRLPLITTLTPMWALADVEDLLPSVVVASTPDLEGTRLESTIVSALRSHTRAELLYTDDPRRVEVPDSGLQWLEEADLIVAVVTGEHVQQTGNDASFFEELLEGAGRASIPVLALISPEAWRVSDEQRRGRSGLVRTVVERLTDPTNPPPMLRVVNLPDESFAHTAIHSLLNGMSRWGLSIGSKLGRHVWSDRRLKDREETCRSVWIYTRTFYFELDDQMWRRIVLRNAEDNTPQRWLFPPDLRSRARELAEACRRLNPTAPIEFYELAQPVWWPELCIYDPETIDCDAFVYSLEGETEDSPVATPLAVQFNFRLGDELALTLTDEFKSRCTPDRRVEF